METLRIGDVARRASVQPSAVRYYERIGLLSAPLRAGGQRRYDASVLRQLAIIAAAQSAGFTLAEIKTLLTGLPDIPLSARWRFLAERKRGELAARIAQAEVMKRVLAAGTQCQCHTPDDCTVTTRCSASVSP